MRMARIAEAGGYYHIVSRVIDRQMLFDDNEKERFRDLLHRVVAFSGVRLLTYAILDNHFHLLVHVPPAQPVDDATFLKLKHADGLYAARRLRLDLLGLPT